MKTSELNGTFHARSHEYSPYRKVTVDLVQIVVLGAAKLLVHVVEDFFHKLTILTRNMKIAIGQISHSGTRFRSRNGSFRARVRVCICGPHFRT